MTTLRDPHYLEPTKGNERPSQFIFFDTETYNIEQEDGSTKLQLKLGIARFYRTRRGQRLRFQSEKIFKASYELWEWLDEILRDRTTTYLIAHNLPFDLVTTDAFHILPLLGWDLKSFYFKGQTSIFRWQSDTRKIVGLDNGNFFTGKLSKWGDIAKIPKLKIDFDETSNEYLIEYCRRDVEIMAKLWIIWLDFLDINDCGSFRPTVSSTAFNMWRYRFLTRKIWIHSEKRVLELERQAYYGGRCEPLYIGKFTNDNYYYLDFNSLYPSVMRGKEYPISIVDHKKEVSVPYLARKLSKYAVVAEVSINASQAFFPLRKDGRLVFPLGRFKTTLTTPELKIALMGGMIEKVHYAAWYRKATLFDAYVDYIYPLRKKFRESDNQGFSKICKLLLNSLYGKFGQRGLEQKIVGHCPIDTIERDTLIDIPTKRHGQWIKIAGNVYQEYQSGESYHSFPAIAAHVTAYGRVKLWQGVLDAGRNNVFYVDTDSILTNQAGYDRLQNQLHNDKLGSLKVEQASSWVEVRGRKDYAMQDRNKIKGIRQDANELSENVFSQVQFTGLRGLINNGDINNILTKQITKHLKREIRHGAILDSGLIYRIRLDSDD